jgi:N-acetylglucosaminyldiphosphoundecaprenol N-acetyl-beta-D-mannosaminyltransferase
LQTLDQVVENQSLARHGTREPTQLTALNFFGVPVHPVSYDEAFDLVRGWAERRSGRCVCLVAVAVVIYARDFPEYRRALAHADLALPDGMPVVWFLRRSGYPNQERLCGPDLIYRMCADAARHRIAVGFLGNTAETLQLIRQRFGERWPALEIGYAHSPPFRPLTAVEESAIVDDINRSGIGLLFVGLGCPKQELFMARARERSQVVMIGLGAAFNVAAGTQSLPPPWVQRMGMHWAHRILEDPLRLGYRYLTQNARFCWLLLKEGLSRSASHRGRRSRPR